MFDEIGIFYRGLVLGLMIAAPVGPIGLLCIRRTIQKGFLTGFVTGLGAAGADTFFAALASFSVAAILEFVRHYDYPIRLLGSAFLLIVAYHTWHDPPRQPPQNRSITTGLVTALLSGFIITMTNPVTIFAILAVVATFGGLHGDRDAAIIVAGIFAGSTLWWVLLSGGVSLVRTHFTENRVVLINRFTAVVLALLAFWVVVSSLAGFMGYKTLLF
ncbi:MAG: LysE family translocator [Bdellovibrionales bacterium]